MLFYISFGSEISDRPSCWNSITKSMVVYPSLYYTKVNLKVPPEIFTVLYNIS
jgi:hypothetical protein